MQDTSMPFVSSIKNKQALRADFMAKKFLNNNITDFLKEVRTLNNSRISIPCTVDGVSGADSIVELMTALLQFAHEVHQAVNKLSRPYLC